VTKRGSFVFHWEAEEVENFSLIWTAFFFFLVLFALAVKMLEFIL
jgi:hypothetical protein